MGYYSKYADLDFNHDGRIDERDFDLNGDGRLDAFEKELAIRDLEHEEVSRLEDQFEFDRAVRKIDRHNEFVDELQDRIVQHEYDEDYLDTLDQIDRYRRERY